MGKGREREEERRKEGRQRWRRKGGERERERKRGEGGRASTVARHHRRRLPRPRATVHNDHRRGWRSQFLLPDHEQERATAKRGAGGEKRREIKRERERDGEEREGRKGRQLWRPQLGQKLRFSGRLPYCLAVTLAWLRVGVRVEGGSHDGEKYQGRGSEEGERDGQRREGKERKRGWLQCGYGSRWLWPRWLWGVQLPGEGSSREREMRKGWDIVDESRGTTHVLRSKWEEES